MKRLMLLGAVLCCACSENVRVAHKPCYAEITLVVDSPSQTDKYCGKEYQDKVKSKVKNGCSVYEKQDTSGVVMVTEDSSSWVDAIAQILHHNCNQ